MQGITNAGHSGFHVYCSLEAPKTVHDEDIWVVTDTKVTDCRFVSEGAADYTVPDENVVHIVQSNSSVLNRVPIYFEKQRKIAFWPFTVVIGKGGAKKFLNAFVLKNKKWVPIVKLSFPLFPNSNEPKYIGPCDVTYGKYEEQDGYLHFKSDSGMNGLFKFRVSLPFDLSVFSMLRIQAGDYSGWTFSIVDPVTSNQLGVVNAKNISDIDLSKMEGISEFDLVVKLKHTHATDSAACSIWAIELRRLK